MNPQLDEITDLLWAYKGATPVELVRTVLAEVEWLRNELAISQRNEQAFQQVLEQERQEWLATRSMLRYARAYLADVPNVPWWLLEDSHHGGSHEQARQATGPEGAEQERTDSGSKIQRR